MRIDDNTDFVCDTDDCTYWKEGVCTYPAAIVIQEHCCVIYEARISTTRQFSTEARMAEIANAAIDSFGELLNGRALYEALTGALKMNDEEILAAGFSTLKEFMGCEIAND